MGPGYTSGTYRYGRSVENEALEVISAINTLKKSKKKVPIK